MPRAVLFVAVAAVATRTAAGLAACPPDNNPLCWQGEFTCRRCCDLSLGPKGDAACWVATVNYDSCCKRWAIKEFEDPEVILWCRHMAAWLTAGSDLATLNSVQLRWFHRRATKCPPLAMVVKLAVVAPQLASPSGDEGLWALAEAEGILQWFVDNMVPMLGNLQTQTFAAFFTLHRILAAGAPQAATHQALSAPGGALRRSNRWVESLARSLRWSTAYSPAAVSELLADAWATAGHNASRVQPAAAPLPCSMEAALGLAAMADLVRLDRGAESIQFHWSLRAVQRCLDDLTKRNGPLLQQLWRASATPLLLALDRLECRPFIRVDPDDKDREHGMRALVVQLLPFRDWESDFMRAYRNFHCGEQVMGLVQRRVLIDPDGMFVDVGANLGGCALWASNYAPKLKVLAVEPYGAAVAALRATAQQNDVADRVQALQACVRHDGRAKALQRVVPSDPGEWAVLQVAWELIDSDGTNASQVVHDGHTGMETVPCVRLDDVVDSRVTVLRIHTSGAEFSALVSAAGLAQRGLLGAVALQFPTLEKARLLWSYGLDLEIGDEPIARGDEAQFQAVLAKDPSGHAVLIGARDLA